MLVVCGEALFDVYAAADTPGGLALDARLGGSPYNVAVALARLGLPVCFLGAVAADFLGDRIVRALASENVSTDWIQRVDAPATLSLVGLAADGSARYRFYGAGGADRLLAVDAVSGLPDDMRALHVGSYATVVEPIASALHELVERCRDEHDAVIAYDPNVRPGVEPALSRWRSTYTWMSQRADLVKFSDEDAALLDPDTPPETLTQRCAAAGPALVVLTRGARGVYACTTAGTLTLDAAPATLVDTVGAGDSFQAAMLARLAQQGLLTRAALRDMQLDQWRDVLTYASRCAAITCSRRGADPPRLADLTN